MNKIRVVDRKNNKYQEKVVDVKTGRILRAVDEKLTDHRKSPKKIGCNQSYS